MRPLTEHWYVACPSGRVTAEPTDFPVCGQPVWVWRAADGAIGADSPLTVVEQDHYVWAYHGDSPSTPPPSLVQLQQPRRVWEQGSIEVRANFLDAVENALDMVHASYVHRWTHPEWYVARLPWRATLTLRYRATAYGLEADGYMGRWRVFQEEFHLPNRIRLVFPALGADAMAIMTPVAETASRIEYMVGRPAWPWETPHVRFVPGVPLLHRQDQLILEAQQAAKAQGAVEERHCPADAYMLFFRQLYALAERGAYAAAWSALPEPPPLAVRI